MSRNKFIKHLDAHRIQAPLVREFLSKDLLIAGQQAIMDEKKKLLSQLKALEELNDMVLSACTEEEPNVPS